MDQDMDGIASIETVSLKSSPRYKLRFKNPVEVNVVHYDDDSDIYLEHDGWDIYGSGPDLDQAIENWWQDLDAIYSDLSKIAEDGLGARFGRIKRAMDAEIERL